MLELNKVHCGDALKLLKELGNGSVNCVVTSPPYWALRDYGVDGQIGLESTFEEYIKKLCYIFDEVKRILRDDGTCWVNLGDTYSESGGAGNQYGKFCGKNKIEGFKKYKGHKVSDYPSKCLTLVPFRFATEMINRGWILRNVIIWHKPNCMPSSVKDRFTVDFEYIFFFVKQKKYWFETQYEPYDKPMNRWGGEKLKADGVSTWDEGVGQDTYRSRNMRPNPLGRNARATWSICPRPFPQAHFAVFPEELPKKCIKAGCPENGVVLDPFTGSGTTGLVACELNRNFIGFDINQEYCDMATKRIKPYLEQTKLQEVLNN